MRLTLEELAAKLEELIQQPDAATSLAALLEEVQPFDLAEALQQLSEEESRRALATLEPGQAAEVMEHLEYYAQYRLLHHMEPADARQIMDHMPADMVADLIGSIHPRQAEQLLKLLPPQDVTTIRTLAEYPENSAGGRMTVDFISVRQSMTAEQVLTHIRKVGAEAETISYIYVVDGAGRLVGVVSLRELIMAAPKDRVSEFLNSSVVSVPASMDQEEVANIVSDYDFVAVPVVAADNRLIGIITVDDVIDVIQEEATEDVYRMGATSVPEETLGMPFLRQVWALAKPRLPWLVGLLFLELGSSFIVTTFSGYVTPTVAALLAVFTVVMAGETGNAATQSLAVVVRGLATGEIKPKDMPRVVLREALVGLVVGLIAGATLMLGGWLWQGNLIFGLAAGLALMANLFVAKVLGGLFPVVIYRLGIDPAVASGPFITTLTDNTSMLIYYSVAAVVLRNFG
ncbi:MAG TPA: magnesium transporter [Symbiobacteriaceae bacterium]|jgi:magnesium transporter